MMSKTLAVTSIILAALGCAYSACGKKDGDDPEGDGSESPIGTLAIDASALNQVTRSSIQTLPTINTAGALNPGTLALSFLSLRQSLTSEVPVGEKSLQDLFAFQCWNRAEDDYGKHNSCPEPLYAAVEAGNIETIPGDTKHYYEFGHFSLLGMIFHAQVDSKAIFAKESTAAKIIPSSLEYQATRSYDGNPVSGGAGDKYVVRFPAGYDRYAGSSGDGRHYFWNDSLARAKQKRFLAMMWYKMINSTQNGGGPQTYLSMDSAGTTPRVFALNQVMSYTSSSREGFRMVLLMNFETNRFVYKGGAWGTLGNYDAGVMTLAGSGGFDFSSRSWKDGAYFARFSNGTEYCIDSKRQAVIATEMSQECNVVSGYFSNSTDFIVSEFLGLNETETEDLMPLLEILKTSATLTSDQTPQGTDDAKNIFDTVTFQRAD